MVVPAILQPLDLDRRQQVRLAASPLRHRPLLLSPLVSMALSPPAPRVESTTSSASRTPAAALSPLNYSHTATTHSASHCATLRVTAVPGPGAPTPRLRIQAGTVSSNRALRLVPRRKRQALSAARCKLETRRLRRLPESLSCRPVLLLLPPKAP